jgi:hypothetical protein
VSGNLAIEMLGNYLTDPERLAEDWSYLQSAPDTTLYSQAPVSYVGSGDPLVGRFVLIAFTDVVVDSVDHYGPLGWGLVTAGFESIIPSFIDPDKTRLTMNNYLTWYYGLGSWGVVGDPAIGLFGDSYAVAGLATVMLLPFLFMGLVLFELQLTGTRIGGNFMGVIMTLFCLHSFGEDDCQGFVGLILRAIPQEMLWILGVFLCAGYLATARGAWRRLGPTRGPAPAAAVANRSARMIGTSAARPRS